MPHSIIVSTCDKHIVYVAQLASKPHQQFFSTLKIQPFVAFWECQDFLRIKDQVWSTKWAKLEMEWCLTSSLDETLLLLIVIKSALHPTNTHSHWVCRLTCACHRVDVTTTITITGVSVFLWTHDSQVNISQHSPNLKAKTSSLAECGLRARIKFKAHWL